MAIAADELRRLFGEFNVEHCADFSMVWGAHGIAHRIFVAMGGDRERYSERWTTLVRPVGARVP